MCKFWQCCTDNQFISFQQIITDASTQELLFTTRSLWQANQRLPVLGFHKHFHASKHAQMGGQIVHCARRIGGRSIKHPFNFVEGGEHEYGLKPELEVVFATVLWEKRISRFFWGFLVSVAKGLGGRYLGP